MIQGAVRQQHDCSVQTRGEIPTATEGRRQQPESLSPPACEQPQESLNYREERWNQGKLTSNFVGKQNEAWYWDSSDHCPPVMWSGWLKPNVHLGLSSIWEISSNFAFLKVLGANPLQATSCQACQDTCEHIKILLLCVTACMRNALWYDLQAQTENTVEGGTLSR